MKTIIRTVLLPLTTAAALLPCSLHAQATDAPEDGDLKEILEMTRSDLNQYKIHTLNQAMQLTGTEAEAFWPIYRAYEKELARLQDQNVALALDFLELEAARTMDGPRWSSLARRWLASKQEQLKLWEWYQKRISQKVSPYRAAQFLQVEHQMRLFLDLNIASEMPVITTAGVPKNTPTQADVPTREESRLVTITATVEAVDLDRRELTLTGPFGYRNTFVVDERVKRLNEVKVGDLLRVEYYVSVVGELRAPTAEEKSSPLVIEERAGRVPPGAQPAGGALRLIKAVCTIEGLNRLDETVTLQGPMGRVLTVQAAVPANLPALRIGDTVVVTYTEALAVALEEISETSR